MLPGLISSGRRSSSSRSHWLLGRLLLLVVIQFVQKPGQTEAAIVSILGRLGFVVIGIVLGVIIVVGVGIGVTFAVIVVLLVLVIVATSWEGKKMDRKRYTKYKNKL